VDLTTLWWLCWPLAASTPAPRRPPEPQPPQLQGAGLSQTGTTYPVFMHFRRRASGPGAPPGEAGPSSSQAPVITITTPITLNRMGRLAQLAATWQGPVSAALFLCSMEDLVTAAGAYDRSDDLKAHVDLHVVVGAARYFPVNIVRNVALNGGCGCGAFALALVR
jgi:hypothetical protein